jgi:hypothetical protein
MLFLRRETKEIRPSTWSSCLSSLLSTHFLSPIIRGADSKKKQVTQAHDILHKHVEHFEPSHTHIAHFSIHTIHTHKPQTHKPLYHIFCRIFPNYTCVSNNQASLSIILQPSLWSFYTRALEFIILFIELPGPSFKWYCAMLNHWREVRGG